MNFRINVLPLKIQSTFVLYMIILDLSRDHRNRNKRLKNTVLNNVHVVIHLLRYSTPYTILIWLFFRIKLSFILLYAFIVTLPFDVRKGKNE